MARNARTITAGSWRRAPATRDRSSRRRRGPGLRWATTWDRRDAPGLTARTAGSRVGHPCCDHAALRVAGQGDVVQTLELKHRADILHVIERSISGRAKWARSPRPVRDG